MNLIFSQRQIEKNDKFQIVVNNVQDLQNYLLCLKDSMFDLVFADINEKDVEFFINIKSITKITSLLKQGSEIRLIFQQPLQEIQIQKLKQMLSILDLIEINSNEQNFIYHTINNEKQSEQIKQSNKSNSFGISTFDQAVKVNPFAQFQNNDKKIDEDSLLQNDQLEKKQQQEDCSTKPTTCKNCTCKRSTENNQDLNNLKSNCGNCYLGDAFRCGSCPFKGQPAFQPGDKIKIDLSSITTDKNEKNDTIVKDGKIKIDL